MASISPVSPVPPAGTVHASFAGSRAAPTVWDWTAPIVLGILSTLLYIAAHDSVITGNMGGEGARTLLFGAAPALLALAAYWSVVPSTGRRRAVSGVIALIGLALLAGSVGILTSELGNGTALGMFTLESNAYVLAPVLALAWMVLRRYHPIAFAWIAVYLLIFAFDGYVRAAFMRLLGNPDGWVMVEHFARIFEFAILILPAAVISGLASSRGKARQGSGMP